ncbi:DUF4236 domain-containing protein [Corynebacterium macginleyi]|uniref:DUF4236 domain-containing protein n=2 Tax=Corynebacterium macginleyi TaxID=38290 RepID=UPI00190E2A30|nr:DUF4236 domain-containing protein [Corynebacterium macginleyi]MBK4149468.1 DUF4236 domain-containing protein [Corynebacterium macginleyi]MBK4159298.1 DUF4236 domain-containing protein [Corynebacterium macginleyi]
MGMQFRRSKKVGPFNFTVSKTGVSGSVGAGPFRYTMNSKGGRTKTIRTGIPGLYYQERESAAKRRRKSSTSGRARSYPNTTPPPRPQAPPRRPGNQGSNPFKDAES